MRLLALILTLSSTPAWSGGFVADAFGLYSAADTRDGRELWAGTQRPTSEGRSASRRMPEGPDRILVFAGPKSLVAGSDDGHVVTVLLDRHGNLVADGTPVEMRIAEETASLRTLGGIADRLFQPPPSARELLIGATSGQRQSARAMVRVVADIGSVTPQLASLPGSFPYEAFMAIPTRHLKDRFGNEVTDGTAVSILLDHKDGSYSLATAAAARGQAEATFLSRDIWGQAATAALLGGNESGQGSVVIEMPRPMAEPGVALEPLPAIAALRFTVGPFLTGAGHVLGDGAAIRFEVSEHDGPVHEALDWTRDGYASAIVPIARPDMVEKLVIASPLGRMELGRRWTMSARLEVME